LSEGSHGGRVTSPAARSHRLTNRPTVKTQAETEHDFRVDLIVTPDEVIACGAPRRPPGLMWEQLDAAKIAAIPALASLVPGRP
jgi:hypothetical protein